MEEKYNLIVCNLRAFLKKSGFAKVLIGLSGGIDSAFTAVVAADAVGTQNVHAVMMPSCYTTKSSIEDATEFASGLNLEFSTINIDGIFKSFKSSLSNFLKPGKESVTKENLQARIRGTILMALCNEFGKILLATGNRSEVMTGYCTLYGDTCGAFAPISHLFKTEVYQLARWRNQNIPTNTLCQKKELISDAILKKAPTAELRDDQKDSDFLPEYEILDKILSLSIDFKQERDQIIKRGFSRDIVDKVLKLIKDSHHKRAQLPIGIKSNKL